MTTRPDEVTGGRTVLPDRPFEFGTPSNFTITWANVTLGVLNGEPFMVAPPRGAYNRVSQRLWIASEVLFLRTMTERLLAYAGALGVQPEIDDEDEDPEDPAPPDNPPAPE